MSVPPTARRADRSPGLLHQVTAGHDPEAVAIRFRHGSRADELTYRELEITNPAYWAYMASFTQKEVMAQLNLGQGTGALGASLPL